MFECTPLPYPVGSLRRVLARAPSTPHRRRVGAARPVSGARSSRCRSPALVAGAAIAPGCLSRALLQGPENEKADSAFGGGAGLLSRPLDRCEVPLTSWSCSAVGPRLATLDSTMIPLFGATILATAHRRGGDVVGGPEGTRGAIALRGGAEVGQRERHGRGVAVGVAVGVFLIVMRVLRVGPRRELRHRPYYHRRSPIEKGRSDTCAYRSTASLVRELRW